MTCTQKTKKQVYVFFFFELFFIFFSLGCNRMDKKSGWFMCMCVYFFCFFVHLDESK